MFISSIPYLRKLSVNMLILGRVVPIISNNSSCEIFSSMQMPGAILLPSVRATAKASRAQSLLAINRRYIGDHLLLVDNAHGQVTHKAFK